MKQTATLVAITQVPVDSKHKTHEEGYEYKVGDQTVKFHAHPDKAFLWIITGDVKLAFKIIHELCRIGFEPAKIQTLSI